MISPLKVLKKISYLGLTFTSLVLSPESFGGESFDKNENINLFMKRAITKKSELDDL